MELQLGARASSTVCKYRAAWFKWRTWAFSKIDVPVIPAQPAHVALFITQLANTAKVKGLGFSTLEGAAYGIAWVHKIGGLTESPTDYPLVKMTVQNAAYPNLSNRKSHCLVGYAGFLRADEILKIKVCDFKILVDHMLVSVPERKNDQYRQGHIVPVIRSNKATCPVCITEKILALLPLSENKNLPLVRRIVKSKSKEYFHPCKSVSYSTIRDEFKKFLGQFVSNVNDFALHSIKSGATSNPGCRLRNDNIIDRHAGWRHPVSKNRYVQYTTNDLLKVTHTISWNLNYLFRHLCSILSLGKEEIVSWPQPRFPPKWGFFLASRHLSN